MLEKKLINQNPITTYGAVQVSYGFLTTEP